MVEVLGNRLEAGMEVGMGWSKYLVDVWDGWREWKGGVKRGRGMVDLSAWGEGMERGRGQRNMEAGTGTRTGAGAENPENGDVVHPKSDLAIIPKYAHRVRVRVHYSGGLFVYCFILSLGWKGIEILNNNILD